MDGRWVVVFALLLASASPSLAQVCSTRAAVVLGWPHVCRDQAHKFQLAQVSTCKVNCLHQYDTCTSYCASGDAYARAACIAGCNHGRDACLNRCSN
jgi:hypothetical protein